jgi:hypothetical protein
VLHEELRPIRARVRRNHSGTEPGGE